MTDKPTPEQIQRVCDLAKGYTPCAYGNGIANRAFTALADTIAKLDAKDAMIDGQAALIATLTAERDKARADLGEIYIQLDGVSGLHRLADDSRQAIEAAHDLAAPYRVETDPLEAEADKLMAMDQSTRVIVLSALKRGLEIGRQA